MDKKERKQTNLTVKQKLKLIGKLESGISVARVCEEYGHSAISDTPPPN
jgi:hypothetical protein